ncbi:hypothetical protein C8R46DRAFT_1068096 [Mycena filopes]|nr:hypothetical protein C8R46DRAFT_1068096 [Mycena filopes]
MARSFRELGLRHAKKPTKRANSQAHGKSSESSQRNSCFNSCGTAQSVHTVFVSLRRPQPAPSTKNSTLNPNASQIQLQKLDQCLEALDEPAERCACAARGGKRLDVGLGGADAGSGGAQAEPAGERGLAVGDGGRELANATLEVTDGGRLSSSICGGGCGGGCGVRGGLVRGRVGGRIVRRVSSGIVRRVCGGIVGRICIGGVVPGRVGVGGGVVPGRICIGGRVVRIGGVRIASRIVNGGVIRAGVDDRGVIRCRRNDGGIGHVSGVRGRDVGGGGSAEAQRARNRDGGERKDGDGGETHFLIREVVGVVGSRRVN